MSPASGHHFLSAQNPKKIRPRKTISNPSPMQVCRISNRRSRGDLEFSIFPHRFSPVLPRNPHIPPPASTADLATALLIDTAVAAALVDIPNGGSAVMTP